LIPDNYGDYVNGTWAGLAKGPNAPLYYASAVLKDGRVFVAGGEYNAGAHVDLLAAEIYDPIANTWKTIATPPGWTNIGDASCCVLPDGRVLIGSITDSRTAIYDPSTNSWQPSASKNNPTTNEETWTLLPDQTVLTADCFGSPQTEKYVIAADKWVLCGPTPSDLVKEDTHEIGPALLLPDGRTFAIGASGHTALYTMPGVANEPGSWAAGPDFPKISTVPLGAEDAPACLMPNGRALCVAGPINGAYLPPSYFFEFDPLSGNLTTAPSPGNSNLEPYVGRMLLLPTGQVLFANGTHDLEAYKPDGEPEHPLRPQITDCPHHLRRGISYSLKGRQLNGISQAVSYGDDATMTTNYPLLRINNVATGEVHFCRTSNHSTMGVATGNVIHSTRFQVPVGIPVGSYRLSVVANGIHSKHILVTVA
jgi:hypothetical protein